MIDEQTNVNNPQAETTEVNYIEAMAEMRKNMVSKEEYNKIVEENKQLVDTLVSGANIPEKYLTPEPEVDLDALRNDMFTRQMTNLEYAKKVLTLRNELLKRGEKDPFLGVTHNYVETEADIANAEKAAEALQYCVNVAQGNPDIFQNELQRIMVDTVPTTNKNIKNRR